ncbi:DNA-directed RNA polymeras-like proteines i [Ophiobolus disseminans]|uniref:DNA-directed RNA polymerases I, II, and III subunit RPABC3 n=1 Tax=Ophiobolus disseminans TaxID=1469910 RepID=A0A6A7A7A8_9PLEO|nr:DNA-directed RNA polymeras-like proteines i [Ophiobolus disseminans]
MADVQLLDAVFTITEIDNKRYDRVSRIAGTSSDSTLTMTLDINHELFHCQVGESISMALATTLELDGAAKEGAETSWRNVSRTGYSTLADMYDYVCYGRHYKFEDGDGGNAKCYASFGGLLLYLEGPYNKLSSLKIDNFYMLIKRA